jgi:two-component sensor histidine kinase
MEARLQTIESGLGVREANHRSMNMLAVLHTLFRREFSQFADQSVRGAAAKFESQIIATSELLRLMSSEPSERDVEIDVYLERLGRALSDAILSPMNTRFEVCVESGRAPIEVAERLGLIVVELVTNASKYAFPGRENGLVRLKMSRHGGNWRCFVLDNGVGMTAGNRGDGLSIVEALVRSLKGRLIMRTGGSGTCMGVILPDGSARGPRARRHEVVADGRIGSRTPRGRTVRSSNERRAVCG